MEVQTDYLFGETVNGALKRYDFIAQAIETYQPRTVLDIGCGTGGLLTAPLAHRFPNVRFVGADPDTVSIAHAQRNYPLPNLEFCSSSDIDESERFDLVIASEVIEHVEEPISFLVGLRRRLSNEGRMILTVPNGYGPYEMTAIVESFLHLSGVLPALSWLRDRLQGTASHRKGLRDTLAHSPHINWFTQRRIGEVISTSGFSLLEYRPRVFLCGLGLQSLLRTNSLRTWNARIADRLPAGLNSGWMFVAANRPEEEIVERPYRRSAYEQVRRAISERRWGTAPARTPRRLAPARAWQAVTRRRSLRTPML